MTLEVPLVLKNALTRRKIDQQAYPCQHFASSHSAEKIGIVSAPQYVRVLLAILHDTPPPQRFYFSICLEGGCQHLGVKLTTPIPSSSVDSLQSNTVEIFLS